MGGNFEIIIVIIGLAWAIASSVMQKKAKAAKAARLKAIAQEDIASSATSAAPEPSETMFDRMMSQLREQIDVVSEPVAPQRSGSGGGSAANIGAAVKVKPPASVPDPPVQMSDTKSAMQDSVHVAPAQPAPGRTARSATPHAA